MIIKTDQLYLYQKKTVLVDGCFDPFHAGHIDYFKFAAGFGLPVFCNVENDKYINKYKKRPSLIPESQRIIIVDSIKYISYTHLQTSSTHDVLLKLKPLKYIKGADWKKKKLPDEEVTVCNMYGIKIEYTKKNLDSSSEIIRNFINKMSSFKNFK
ncbi:hypothetical protein A3D78_01170 [Candidatus Gottesmanbacteria bacterium RIFCSPHIGHO2_02_FULL_39_14]|uniref:Cytidyltransferase-like domain-containing protein n=1 Tax=Candidatus Gottesmanbacteria bacterium RIFCSPHIGHO2_02_FULL_39_14 TaxID=1798383 RepID=A0A1F5ZV47_9BACT|nr:MAG: hypothetical protein A3D78_01170 [Candidatus Gottesmanbacteria bacterium RIFCSPHIGHO2_02_FULL_39_14]